MDMSDAISEETVYIPNDYEEHSQEVKEYKKPEVLEGSGRIDRISREEKGEKVYYRLSIGNTYYTKFINSEQADKFMSSFSKGDEVKFTWTGKAVNGREFRNIQRIEKIKGNANSGNANLNTYKGRDKTPEEWAELKKRKIDGITFGMALNNAATLIASTGLSMENIEKGIGTPLWKAIEKKLYENYVEQRKEILGE